jgi:hypothetical protein
MIAFTFKKQRPPFAVAAVASVLLVLIVEPLIASGRITAQQRGAMSSSERRGDFSEVLKSTSFVRTDWKNLNVEVFFRGIYPVAGEITRRASIFSGEWDGYTLLWGLEAIVPRVLKPEKRDQNIGNFFSQTIGADLGISSRDDVMNNISPTIMFEIVGNWGLLAGLLAFPAVGLFWAALCTTLLSGARINSHPLGVVLFLTALGIESSVGSFLAGLRDLGLVIFIVWLALMAVSRYARNAIRN